MPSFEKKTKFERRLEKRLESSSVRAEFDRIRRL
jgi:hypothetical protein